VRTSGAVAYGQFVWSWPSLLRSSLSRRCLRAQPGGRHCQFAKRGRPERTRLPGEHGISRQPTAQGRPCVWLHLYAAVQFFCVCLRTADRGCQPAPGLPCALLDERVERSSKARAFRAARLRRCVCRETGRDRMLQRSPIHHRYPEVAASLEGRRPSWSIGARLSFEAPLGTLRVPWFAPQDDGWPVWPRLSSGTLSHLGKTARAEPIPKSEVADSSNLEGIAVGQSVSSGPRLCCLCNIPVRFNRYRSPFASTPLFSHTRT
jgi:hypothetical protein